jgi:O-antigen/teichoic acid export membrane protein
VFFALGRETLFAMFDVGYRLAMLAGMAIALLAFNGTAASAVWIQIVVAVVFAAVAILAAGRAIDWRFPYDGRLVRDMLHHGATFYSYSLFRYALCYGGVLLAAVLFSPREAGLFAVSLMLGEGMLLFAGAVNLAFYPAVAATLDRHRYTVSVAKRIALLSTVIAAVLGFAARPLIELVYGAAFRPSVAPFWCMLPGLVLLTLEQVISSYYAARGMPRRIVVALLAGCVAGVMLAEPSARVGGLTGLAVAISTVQVCVSLAILALFVRDADSQVV